MDENDEFTLPLEVHIEEAGETIHFVIIDENGNSTTKEKKEE